MYTNTILILVLFITNYVNTSKIVNIFNIFVINSNGKYVPKSMEISKSSGLSESTRLSEKMCNLYTKYAEDLKKESNENLTPGFAEKPYVALIGWQTNEGMKWECSGFLVSDNFVITAAHCARLAPTHIRLGQHNTSSIDLANNIVNVKVKKIFIHSKSSNIHDIALIKFRKHKSFKFTKYVQPICLPSISHDNVEKFLAYGWGIITEQYKRIPENNEIILSRTEILKEVKLKQISPQPCKSFNNEFDMQFDNNFHYCAQPLNKYQDTCKGDSGGPIVITDPDKKIEIAIGITSKGYSYCHHESDKYYGVYVKLFLYLDWIEKIVWRTKS